jgi:glutamate/tyrosine decarboxylase-like PLP-dependent enzyme
MIQDDIALAQYLYELAAGHPELEAISNHLSITTMRYVPRELRASLGSDQTEHYLNQLNQRLLAAIEKSGEAFLSNALVGAKYALRFCIVNFRASTRDIEAMPQLVVHLGRQAHAEMHSSTTMVNECAPRES